MKYKYISVDGWSIQRSKGGDIITAIEEFYMEWIEDGNESKEGNNLSMDILLWILQVAQTKKITRRTIGAKSYNLLQDNQQDQM